MTYDLPTHRESVRSWCLTLAATPGWGDYAEDKARALAGLAELSRELTPAGTREVGRRILAHLDPDGSLTDDADRARGFTVTETGITVVGKGVRVTP